MIVQVRRVFRSVDATKPDKAKKSDRNMSAIDLT